MVRQILQADANAEPCLNSEPKARMKEKQNRPLSYSDGYLPFSSEDSHHFNYNGKAANEHHSSVSKHLSGVKDTYMMQSGSNDEDLLNTPELECSIIMNDFTIHNKNELAELVPPVITTSEMFQEDRNIYTDEGVLDYKPELIVCYKEINCNAAKDVCVDEEMPLADKCPSKEEGNAISPLASKSKCLAYLMDLDDQNHDVLLQANEKDAGITIENNVMVEEPIVTRLLSMEKFGTRSFHRSFMKPSSSQEDEAQQLKQVVEHADINKRHQESVLDDEYPKSPSVVSEILSSRLYGSSMKIHQVTEPNCKEGSSANTFKAQRIGIDGNTVCEVQNADVEENYENINKQPIAAHNIVDAENPFPLNECKKLIEEYRSIQKSHRQLHHEIWSSDSHANTDVPSARVNEIGGNGSYTIPGESYHGEDIILDVSSQITYSGPVTDSGSTSMRSESSSTSAKSFAFPVLQPEWHSSPVKMGSANRSNSQCLSKQQRKWKQCILCCKF